MRRLTENPGLNGIEAILISLVVKAFRRIYEFSYFREHSGVHSWLSYRIDIYLKSAVIQ